ADTALAGASVDDEGDDPDDPVVMLEAGQCAERDEPEHRAVVLGADALGVVVREPLEAGDDVARSGRIALVGEQGRDRFCVAWGPGEGLEWWFGGVISLVNPAVT